MEEGLYMADIIHIAPARLEAWSNALLIAAGIPQAEAAEITAHLLFADLRGIDTHGTSRLKIYLTRMSAGIMNATANIKIERETPVSALIDGGNGFGQVVARKATDLAIEKAKKSGVGIVVVKSSNHCGAMAYYTLKMAEEGLIGFATTNSPANMPPFGGKAAYFGTNPISVAVPAGKNAPFVFDMATTQVARGKIINAAREGKPIPEGWAMNKDGHPTTDAKEALDGFLLPAGGAKGSALSFFADIVTGVITGGPFGDQIPRMYEQMIEPQHVAHFFWAFRPDLFMDLDEFKARMDQVLDEVRQIPPAPGFSQVLAPGDVERAKTEANQAAGIPIPPGIRKDFAELAAKYGVPLPSELA